MENTILKYLDNTYCFASLASIIDIGSDDKGYYLIFDQTIAYPGGGGQPMDTTVLSRHHEEFATVHKCNFNGGKIKYYIDHLPPSLMVGEKIAMHVDRRKRIQNAAYHSGGHWIASIITENLRLPLVPTKGFHFSKGAYVEFLGNLSDLPVDILYQIEYAMRIDRQAQLKIRTSIISTEEFYENQASIATAKGFAPLPDRPLRLVTFENYKSVPCGGTHVNSISEIKSIKATKVKVKNGKIRVSYSVTVPELVMPS